MSNWDTDTQFEEHRLTRVENGVTGWSLYFDGMGLFCPNDLCQQVPVAGETARLYGKGFGYPVRGIIIDGRVYKYLTEEGEKEEHANQVAAQKRKRAEQLETERVARDARRAALPEAFRERLDTFEKRNPSWRAEYEPYELMVCEDAARLAAHFGKDTVALKAFNDVSWEGQKALIPTIGDGHSGNSWSCAISLALRFMTDPKLIRGAHGALCPLVGCTEYGCPGADVKKES
jgi:hypothetical protein